MNRITNREYMISRKPTKNQSGLFQTSIYKANTFPQTIICAVFGKTENECLENARTILKGLNPDASCDVTGILTTKIKG